MKNSRAEILFITSYPPRVCGIATYSQDLIRALNDKFSNSFRIIVHAMSCACPIISTPIPHAKEVLTTDTGIIIDFRNSGQLASAAIRLLNDEPLRKNISSNTLQKIVSTAWENSADAHAMLFERIAGDTLTIRYNIPEIKLEHVYQMTTNTGIIQFSKRNQPDLSTGYTLDGNARALVAMCMYFKRTKDKGCIFFIRKYLGFIGECLQPTGDFLNYMNLEEEFTEQNRSENLDDANGRAIWALGYLVSFMGQLPLEIVAEAIRIIEKSLFRIGTVLLPRAIAFFIKGLYHLHSAIILPANLNLLKTLATRLVEMYKQESNENGIKVISNNNWQLKGENPAQFGEQPIDVAYTIMTLSRFYDVLKDEEYFLKMTIAFNRFLGNDHLHQLIYNPCTGGCYDGLKETQVNLNQGAEPTVSYLMARLTIEKYR